MNLWRIEFRLEVASTYPICRKFLGGFAQKIRQTEIVSKIRFTNRHCKVCFLMQSVLHYPQLVATASQTPSS